MSLRETVSVLEMLLDDLLSRTEYVEMNIVVVDSIEASSAST